MDKTKKRRIKQYISWGVVVALVVLLAAMPLLTKDSGESDGPVITFTSDTTQARSIPNALSGGGMLTQEAAVEVTLPMGVKLESFCVSNGAVVSEGDPIAKIDRVSVMQTITQVQETLDHLTEEMDDAADEENTDKLTAQTDGRVKLIYAQAGDSVADVIREHGALAVLSLDGRMAVEFQTDAALTVGGSVTVVLSDETEVSGRVESTLGGNMIVTVPDEGYAVGESVKILTADGEQIAGGELYIHNAWNVIAYYGTVSDVNVDENEEVDAGDTLFKLEDTGSSAQYQLLSQQRQEYEDVMLELFQLYQSEYITAPCDGVVSGIDENSIHLLSDNGTGWTLQLLVNAPNGDDTVSYTNLAAKVTAVENGTWTLAVNPANQTILDYKDLSGMSIDPAGMTETVTYAPAAPIYALVEGEWQQIDAASIGVEDILLFAGDETGNFVWIVRVVDAQPEDPGSEETQPTEPSEPTVPSEPTDPTTPSEPEPTDPTTPSDPTTPTQPGGTTPTTPTMPSGGTGGMGGYSGYGGYSGGTVQTEPEFELYDLTGNIIGTVTPQDTMTLEISVDETDIGKVFIGQTADITIHALGGEPVSGTVTKIGSASNSGGNSKFTVTIQFPRGENILSGMSASASLSLTGQENVLTVPAAAIYDQGSEVVVYCGYDPENDMLTDPVTVTIGASDGEYVQILTGLADGQTVWYGIYESNEDPM